MAAVFCGDGWLKVVAGSGSYNKYIAKASSKQPDPNPAAGTISAADKSPAGPSIPSIESVSDIQLPPPTLERSQTILDAAAKEPVPVICGPSSARKITSRTSGSVLSSSGGITPPSPASLHTQTLSRAPLSPHSSTPEELHRLEEYLHLSTQAQLEAFITPGEFLTVSADVCSGNMVQKHAPGSLWGANLAFSDEELQGKHDVPAPFRPRPCDKMPRPPGYYDAALRLWAEDSRTTRRREALRTQQAEEAKKLARAQVEKAARMAEKAAHETEKTGKAPRDVKGKGKVVHKVQWAEQLESHWRYS